MNTCISINTFLIAVGALIIMRGCVSTPFEVAGDVVGASFDAAGAVVEVPFKVAGAAVKVPFEIADPNWEGHGRHRLHYTAEEHWTTDADSVNRIQTETHNGSIIVQATGGSQIHVQSIINVYSRSKDNALAYAERILIDREERRNTLSIQTKRPHPSKNIMLAVHHTIYTPSMMDLSLKTSNGKMEITGIHGEIQAKTTNGLLSTINTSGYLNARTTNGKIKLSGVTGSFDTETTNGAIFVNALYLHHESQAETTNSKVQIEIAKGNVPLHVTTTNGSVDVTLPPQYNGKLNARTTNGSIRTDIPVRVYEAKKNELKGNLGSGGTSEIYIRSTNGSIRLHEYQPQFATAGR